MALARGLLVAICVCGCRGGDAPHRTTATVPAGDTLAVVADTQADDAPHGLADSLEFSLPSVTTGADTAEVRRRLGAPDSTKGESGADPHASYEHWYYRGLRAHFDHERRLTGVLILSSSWPTKRGLRVGDSLARMRALYGAPQRNVVENLDYYTWNRSSELVLMVTHSGSDVRQMYLGWNR